MRGKTCLRAVALTGLWLLLDSSGQAFACSCAMPPAGHRAASCPETLRSSGLSARRPMFFARAEGDGSSCFASRSHFPVSKARS